MQYLDINDAYIVQRRFANVLPDVRGWKLGGSNTLTRDLFKVTEPYFGFLRESQIFGTGYRQSAELTLNTFEVEICVHVPTNYCHSNIYSAEEIQTWDACMGLEFPETQIVDLPRKGVAHLIADNCAAGALFVSETMFDLRQGTSIEISINGVQVTDELDLISDASQIVSQFLDITKKHGFSIEPGQIIATGGITKLLTLERGQIISISNQSELVLEFTK